MDRTEEYSGIVKIFLPKDRGLGEVVWTPRALSGPILECKKVHGDININEQILNKISKLSSCREYSNDPSAEISAQSESFQRQVVFIQNALDRLKKQISQFKSSSALHGKHHQLHFEIILETLQKQVATQASSFQEVMKRHFEHKQERQKRVIKYGQSTEAQLLTASPGSGSSRNYALFSGNKFGQQAPSSNQSRSELRRRATGSTGGAGKNLNAAEGSRHSLIDLRHEESSTSNFQISAQEIRKNAASRVQNAENIEAIVTKMGGLFSRMASLIVEQGETITRIEDDVETGFQQTSEAQDSMQYFYEITKGNRSMIFKIFGLLIFFIFLFLVWLR